MKEYPRKFEIVSGSCHRLKIFGGWIVETMVDGEREWSISTIFIPDPNHEWKLEPKEEK